MNVQLRLAPSVVNCASICVFICALMSGHGLAEAKGRNRHRSSSKGRLIKDPTRALQRQCPRGIKVKKTSIQRKEHNLKTDKMETIRGAEWACKSSLGAVYGKLVRIFSDGVRHEERYNRGKRSGLFQAWYRDGRKKAQGQYKVPTSGKLKGLGGFKHGLWIHWGRDGKVEEKATYRYGDVVGTRLRWFPNGKLAVKETRAPGTSTSKEVQWWKNGRKRVEASFKRGRMHGVTRGWFQNGKRAMEWTWVNGKLHGLGREWHANGKKKLEASSIEGKQDGLLQTWHPNGKRQSRINFQDGKRHGLAQTWHSNGKRAAQATYQNGKLVGKLRQWDAKGRIQRIQTRKKTKRTRKGGLLGQMKDLLK